MSILHPDIGELVDRRTILVLKINHLDRTDWRRETLEHEVQEIANRLRELHVDWWGGVRRPMIVELETVNQRLWELEDQIRKLPGWRVFAIARTAREIHCQNDKRARIVAQLATTGEEAAVSGLKIFS